MSVILLVYLRITTALLFQRILRMYLGFSGVSALGLALSFCALPLSSAIQNPAPSAMQLSFFLVLALEVLLGFLLGLPLLLFMEIVPLAGRMLDTLRGAQFAEQMDALIGERRSHLETGVELGVFTFFLSLGLLPLFAANLTLSFVCFPPGELLGQELSLQLGAERFYGLLSFLFSGVILLIAPAVLLMFVFEVVACVLLRAGGRLALGSELASVRLLCGLLLACLNSLCSESQLEFLLEEILLFGGL